PMECLLRRPLVPCAYRLDGFEHLDAVAVAKDAPGKCHVSSFIIGCAEQVFPPRRRASKVLPANRLHDRCAVPCMSSRELENSSQRDLIRRELVRRWQLLLGVRLHSLAAPACGVSGG